MSKNPGKTNLFIKVLCIVLFGAVVVAAVDLLVQLKKEKDALAQNEEASLAKTLWSTADVSDEVVVGYRGIPLEVQVSEGSTVFISYSPDDAPPISPSSKHADAWGETYKAKPYDFSEMLTRIMLFKIEREKAGADMSVVLTGDDKVKCVSFMRALEEIKRAQIPSIFIDTDYRATGIAVRHEQDPSFICGCGVPGFTYTEWIKKTPQDFAVTVTREDTILLGETPVTLEEFITKTHAFVMEQGSENIQVTVFVDDNSSFAALRWVLDQWRRMGVWRGMVASRKLP